MLFVQPAHTVLESLAKELESAVAVKLVGWQTAASFKKLPKDRQKALRGINYCAFEGCIRSILEGTKQPFMLYCDDATKYSNTVLNLYHDLKVTNPDFRKRCGAIAFAEDEMFAPVQAADMFAYCYRSHLSNEKRPIVEKIYDILTKRHEDDRLIEYSETAKLGTGILAKPKTK